MWLQWVGGLAAGWLIGACSLSSASELLEWLDVWASFSSLSLILREADLGSLLFVQEGETGSGKSFRSQTLQVSLCLFCHILSVSVNHKASPDSRVGKGLYLLMGRDANNSLSCLTCHRKEGSGLERWPLTNLDCQDFCLR